MQHERLQKIVSIFIKLHGTLSFGNMKSFLFFHDLHQRACSSEDDDMLLVKVLTRSFQAIDVTHCLLWISYVTLESHLFSYLPIFSCSLQFSTFTLL